MKHTYRQLFERHLPEPYLSQAIANCQARNRDVDDPEETTGVDSDSLEHTVYCAFSWLSTPEGPDYWRAAARGDFQTPALRLEVGKRYRTRGGQVTGPLTLRDDPTSDDHYPFSGETSDGGVYTWRADGQWFDEFERRADLVSEIVDEQPEPANRLLEPGETILKGDEYRFNDSDDGEWLPYVACVGSPFKGDSFSQSRRPLTAVEARTQNPEPRIADLESRIADLESRIAVLEGLVIEPAAPVCDVVAPPEPATFGGDYPTTPPEPGAGYRLLEKGDPIIRGKAEAWHPEENRWYLGPVRGWEGDTFDPDTDYWFREPVDVPGEGYRLVERGELIETGDEWLEDGAWVPTSYRTERRIEKVIDTPLRRRVAATPTAAAAPALAVGKTYNLRNGDLATITRRVPESEWPWRGDYQGGEHEWRDDGTWSGTRGERDVRDIMSEASPTYRLLNPGEIIREGDEACTGIGTRPGEDDTWVLAGPIGEAYTPHLKVPMRRRLKSYEDA